MYFSTPHLLKWNPDFWEMNQHLKCRSRFTLLPEQMQAPAERGHRTVPLSLHEASQSISVLTAVFGSRAGETCFICLGFQETAVIYSKRGLPLKKNQEDEP